MVKSPVQVGDFTRYPSNLDDSDCVDNSIIY